MRRAIIEQYFQHQYSITQRFAMLASLALGSRELAGQPYPGSDRLSLEPSATFPSKMLPPLAHARLVGTTEQNRALLSVSAKSLASLAETVATDALLGARSQAEDNIPEARREKLLTIKPFSSAKLNRTPKGAVANSTPSKAGFADLAQEFFIMPLINRFWLYLRDISSMRQGGSNPYHGAGESTLLEPLVLARFLATLSILTDVARHSPHFLAILAPEILELTISLRGSTSDESVIAAQLELALVVLDASVAVDGGRTLSRSFRELVFRVKDWADDSWQAGEGASVISRSTRASAAILLRMDEMLAR